MGSNDGRTCLGVLALPCQSNRRTRTTAVGAKLRGAYRRSIMSSLAKLLAILTLTAVGLGAIGLDPVDVSAANNKTTARLVRVIPGHPYVVSVRGRGVVSLYGAAQAVVTPSQ